ncbi:MAG: helix-hairpin-helix domain-containing protein [Thermoleophilia bacterium]|nr:helix-hairpin-helix domain-containing protein [Thermoleophilia bacterium]
MSTRFSLVICLAALALAAALPVAAHGADGSGTDQAPVTLSDEQLSALEDASGQSSDDQSVFQDVSDFVTDNAPYFIIGIVILAAIVAGIFIMRGRSHPEGAAESSTGTGPPSSAEMKRRKRAAIQRSREEERLRRKGGPDSRRSGAQAALPAAAATGAASAAAVDPVTAEKQAARDQRMAAAAVARSGGAIPAPASPSQTAPSAAVTATPVPGPAGSASDTGAEPDTVVTGAPAAAPQPPPAAAFAAGAAGGAVAGRAATSSASPPDEQAPDQAAHDAEARLRAKVEEIKAEQAGTPGASSAEDQLRRVEELERDLEASDPSPPLTPGLASVERRLSADSKERDRTLREAEERLRRVERRAEDAERRAAFAERLAQLKIEESDRERRLNDVVSGIDRAEERAREAEARAESAEKAAAAALEVRDAPRAEVPDTAFPGPLKTGTESGPSFSESRAESPPGRSRRPSGGRAEKSDRPESAGADTGHGAIDLNSATFEDLREADLSVTQATRILAYRERFGGYRSVDDLEKVPGFPEDLIESLRGRITV